MKDELEKRLDNRPNNHPQRPGLRDIPVREELLPRTVKTPDGQEILLDPKIRRLPVNPATYAKAPEGFPNPLRDSSIGARVKFDVDKSKARYNLVNSLFEVVDDLHVVAGLVEGRGVVPG